MALRVFVASCLFLFFRFAACVSEECAALVPQLAETCSAFEYASERGLDLRVEQAEVAAQENDTATPTLSDALNRISEAEFGEECCDLIANLNASRCFCEADVVESLMSDISDELLAFAIFSAARPIPTGCGGLIWTSLDEGACLLLGPEPDLSTTGEKCRSLEDELRSPRRLRGNFALLEEILDLTGVFDELSNLRQFVFFAPTNTGIQNFAEGRNLTIAELLGETELLTNVLRRHTVAGKNIRDLNKNKAEVETLHGTTLTIRRRRNGQFSVQNFPVIQEALDVCRGEVHVINGVLWPPTAKNREPSRETESQPTEPECESVYEILLSLEDQVGILTEQINQFDDIKETLEGPDAFTLFAPLTTQIQGEETVDVEMQREQVKEELERLIVAGDFDSADLEAGQMLQPLSGDTLVVSEENGGLSINGISIIQADLVGCNGRVHIIADQLSIAEEEVIPPEGAGAEPEEEKGETPKEEAAMAEFEDAQGEEGMEALTCPCTSDGLSNGIDTGQPGCAQHGIGSLNNALFCYVEDNGLCGEEDAIFESSSFPGAFWRSCDTSETVLPSAAEALESLEFLQHLSEFFIFARFEDILSSDSPLTMFLPAEITLERSNLENLLEEGQEGAQQIRTLLRRHLVEGSFTAAQLLLKGNVTTLDGTVLSAQTNSEQETVLDNGVIVTRADILIDNGVIHVVDSLIRPYLVSSKDDQEPCECIPEDGEEERVPFGRVGCREHTRNGFSFCYVQNPNACFIGNPSEALPSAKWRACMDPCRCSETGISGSVMTGRRDCDRHLAGSPPFCYIAEPERCNQGTASTGFPGAAWKWCGRQETQEPVAEETPATTVEETPATIVEDRAAIESEPPAVAQESPAVDPCSCTQDGFSGGVDTGSIGCEPFQAVSFIERCYVVNPDDCSFALPSILFSGAAWRFC